MAAAAPAWTRETLMNYLDKFFDREISPDGEFAGASGVAEQAFAYVRQERSSHAGGLSRALADASIAMKVLLKLSKLRLALEKTHDEAAVARLIEHFETQLAPAAAATGYTDYQKWFDFAFA